MQLQDASPQQCRLRPDAAVRVRFNEIDEENAEGLLAVVCGGVVVPTARRPRKAKASASAQSEESRSPGIWTKCHWAFGRTSIAPPLASCLLPFAFCAFCFLVFAVCFCFFFFFCVLFFFLSPPPLFVCGFLEMGLLAFGSSNGTDWPWGPACRFWYPQACVK
jgi:hypothetical protein